MNFKDAFYFPHDSNAKDDPKCTLMIEELGLSSYGCYWVLIELLRDQKDYRYPLNLTKSIARKYNTTIEIVESVIKNYNLFKFDDNFFWSESLIFRMSALEEKREKYSQAGKKSAEARKAKTEETIAHIDNLPEAVLTGEKRAAIKKFVLSRIELGDNMTILRADELIVRFVKDCVQYGEESMIKRVDEAIQKGWKSIPPLDNAFNNPKGKQTEEEKTTKLDNMLG